MSHRSLEDLLGTVESPVELLRNSQTGANVFPGVPPEFTNWRDEQRAWQTTCLLFDQSFHMNDLLVEGPTRWRCSRTSASTASTASPSTGPSTSSHALPTAYVIGDVILFPLAEDEFNLVGPRAGAELGDVPRRDRRLRRGARARPEDRAANDGRRRSYRFQLQGPNAMQVTESRARRGAARSRFFHTTTVTIAGQTVGALASRDGRPAGVGALRAVGGP